MAYPPSGYSLPAEGFVDVTLCPNAQVFMADGNPMDCTLEIGAPPYDYPYMPNKWSMICTPWAFKQNRRGAASTAQCLVCDKNAGNDHVLSNNHKNAIAKDTKLRMEYKGKIERGEIPFPNDGVYCRDEYGSIVDLGKDNQMRKEGGTIM